MSVYNFKNGFICPKIFITFTNSVDPDAMQHYAAFHQGLHCLQSECDQEIPHSQTADQPMRKRYRTFTVTRHPKDNKSKAIKGAQWLSGRVLDSRPRDRGFEPHRGHCVVSFSKNINSSLVLVQPRIPIPL